MPFSIIFDDTSLILTLIIILLLTFTIYIGKGYQPLVHPLILSRQSDVSPIRHKGQSAIYRNTNAPAGLDLASKPRRKINGVVDVLRYGSEASGWSNTRKRNFYGLHRSNADILAKAEKFAKGMASIVGLSSCKELVVAVCVESDSIKSLEATISGSVQVEAFQPLVISSEYVEKGETPTTLPSTCLAKRLHAIFTTSKAHSSALQLPGVDKDTLLVVSTKEEAESIRSLVSNRVILFDEVLSHSADTREEEEKEFTVASEAVHSVYWTGSTGWVEVTNSSLTAAITAHLAFYPAESQPCLDDHIYVATTLSEGEDTLDNSSVPLVGSHHPAGLVLPLLALYSGAAFTTSTLRSGASIHLYEAQPTLIYASSSSAFSFATALSTVSQRFIFSKPAAQSKLAFLRHGTFTSDSLWDRFVFAKVRDMLGCQKLRSLIIISEGGKTSQDLLDDLRIHLSCAVRQAYLPITACPTFGNELTAGVESMPSEVTASASSPALFTAPITATHSLDLQTFTLNGRLAMVQVGPPNVGVEVKLVETALAKNLNYLVDDSKAEQNDGRANDPCGEIFVRGYGIAGTSDAKQWCATGDIGSFRPNGTLVILRDSKQTRPGTEPSLSTEKARGRGSVMARGSTFVSLLSILLCIVACSCQVEASTTPISSSKMFKRANSPINTTLVETAMLGFLSSPRASWEQGTAQSSVLEYASGDWSVFTSSNGRGPPYLPQALRAADTTGLSNQLLSMAYSSVHTQDSVGKLCTQVTGDEDALDGSALDSASCAEAVLIAAFQAGDIANGAIANPKGMWISAAEAQLSYLLNNVTRGSQGALSMRSTGLAYWSDGMYMAPPFLALYGLMTRNQSLIQEGYDQLNYYMQALRIDSGPAEGLLRHIVNGTVADGRTTDNGAWLTGNGWALAGMVKVIAIISQSEFANDMQSQVNDLITWTQDILDGCYKYADPLIRNYVNDTTTFYDAAGSSLVAYATYRLASLSPANHSQHVDAAEAIYEAVQDKLNPFGYFNSDVNVVNALTFTSPSQMSPESLAFLVLLASAKRDHQQGNVTGLSGPASGFAGGATSLKSLLHGSARWIPSAFPISAMLALILI
ncbi:hypothetical protein CBS101457_001574 [Exobasidium rhododendri]|nr:hypothetical protein CBS101457_001574 [Exobasidium rhododendri]